MLNEQLALDARIRHFTGQTQEQNQAVGFRSEAAELGREISSLEGKQECLQRQIAELKELQLRGGKCAERLGSMRTTEQRLSEEVRAKAHEVQQLRDLLDEEQTSSGPGERSLLTLRLREGANEWQSRWEVYRRRRRDTLRTSSVAGAFQASLLHIQARAVEAQSRAAEAKEAWAAERQALALAKQAEVAWRQRLSAGRLGSEESRGAAERAAAAAAGLAAELALPPVGDEAPSVVERVTARLEAAEAEASRAAMQRRLLAAAAAGTHAPSADPGRAPSSSLMLSQCFRFRHEQVVDDRPPLESFLKALSAVAGPSLGVLVCPGAAEAQAALRDPQRALAECGGGPQGASSSGKLRIWPLGSITATDRTHQHRAAVRRLGPDLRAWLPLDLVRPVQARFAPALARAFGGMLVAADEAAASQLSAAHGLACVTLDGDVSRPGSVSGGWAGGGPSAAEALLARKLRAEQAEAKAAAAAAEASVWSSALSRAEAAEAGLKQAKATHELSVAVLRDAEEEVARHEALVAGLAASVEGLRITHETLAGEAAHCGRAAADAASQSKGSSTGPVGGLSGQLQLELSRAEEALRSVQEQQSGATTAVEEAEAELEELNCLVRTLDTSAEEQQPHEEGPAPSSSKPQRQGKRAARSSTTVGSRTGRDQRQQQQQQAVEVAAAAEDIVASFMSLGQVGGASKAEELGAVGRRLSDRRAELQELRLREERQHR